MKSNRLDFVRPVAVTKLAKLTACTVTATSPIILLELTLISSGREKHV